MKIAHQLLAGEIAARLAMMSLPCVHIAAKAR
jgi:hypothetical protein